MKNILLKIAYGIVFLTIFGCEKQEKVINPLPVIRISSDEFFKNHVDSSLQGANSWNSYSKAIKLEEEKKDTVYTLAYFQRFDKIPLKFDELQKFKNLKNFQLNEANQNDINVLKSLPNLSKLQFLHLSGPFGKVELDSLFSKDLSSLQDLIINSTNLDSNFSLENCQNIQSLSLYWVSFPHLLREMKNLKKVRALNLERIHEIDMAQVCKVASQMKNLKALRLDNYKRFDMDNYDKIDTLPKELGLLKNITQLEFRLYGQKTVFPAEIKELKNLKRLYFLKGESDEVIKQVQEKLPKCQIYTVYFRPSF